MITQADKEEMLEYIMLKLPEVIGNLITNHMFLLRMNKKFYDEYPEFKGKKDVVTAVVEMIEGKNPTMSYEEILKKAVPEVKKRLQLTSKLNTSPVDKPNRNLSNFNVSDHGEL